MENYEKGEVKTVEDDLSSLGLDFHASVIHMKVSSGSKIKNLMGYALKKYKEPEVKQVTWNGSGLAVTKAISCAEIMKRKFKDIHQVNKVRYQRVEEYWEPKIPDLERLKVNRDIPAITILLSKEPLDESTPGYQAPGPIESFLNLSKPHNKRSHSGHQGNSKKSNQSHDQRQPPGVSSWTKDPKKKRRDFDKNKNKNKNNNIPDRSGNGGNDSNGSNGGSGGNDGNSKGGDPQSMDTWQVELWFGWIIISCVILLDRCFVLVWLYFMCSIKICCFMSQMALTW